jgi:branched-chain amino acid aminotransferase
LFTAPGDEVLKGITREKIIDICNNLNINVIEKAVSINDLSNLSAFITGTSSKVLPVCSVDSQELQADHPVTRKLMQAYDALILQEIARHNRV